MGRIERGGVDGANPHEATRLSAIESAGAGLIVPARSPRKVIRPDLKTGYPPVQDRYRRGVASAFTLRDRRSLSHQN